MNVLSQFSKNPRIFQHSTGLSIKQFDLFLSNFETAFKTIKSEVGRPYSLNCRDLLIVILMYYKSYMTQEFIGCLVGIDQSNISRLLTKTRELIELVADPELKTYVEKIKQEFDQIALKDRINDWNMFCKKHPDFKEIITDATEQKCFRSKQDAIQKEHYSGKKKLHTRKTQISVSRSGKILDISNSFAGSVHDKKMIDQEQTLKKFPVKSVHRLDSGYQGLPADNPNHQVVIPFKKPKGKELGSLFKQFNHKHSKLRIIVENIFSRFKKFKILKNTYRSGSESYNQVFRNVGAILNFKLQNPA